MLSNNLLFATQERKHKIYQDQLHRLVLLDEPELATTLKHLIFTVKTGIRLTADELSTIISFVAYEADEMEASFSDEDIN